MKRIIIAGILGVFIAGCSNIGNAPTPMSKDEAQDAMKKMSNEDRIKLIETSPLPADEKKRRIDEIKSGKGDGID